MNRGAQVLSRLMPHRGDQIRLANELGLDQGYLSKIAAGKATPGLKSRRLLKECLGIALDAWDEPIQPRELTAGDPDPEAA